MDIDSMIIRPATEDDRAPIRAVHEAAFGRALEADIEYGLHVSGDERISLVAADGDGVVGHVVLSVGSIDDDMLVLCLGPIAVRPDRQRAGAGAALMHAALAEAADTDAGLVVLLGHPSYYPRFGFEPAQPLGVECQWTDGPAWMALRLPRYDPSLRGFVRFPAAFDADTGPAS
ncbi:MAG: GNAT family N-acetyltransferase [Geodermatophilaceae bacterium]